ncbi:hypothetical protein [Tessaracoccus flavescens]|uniref:Uncharacterized protein n=1 Tax=Tessaracoccus flavescens TaxID=399497 RepID=A0A1Q2D0R4_9ACTN|nr:hypothetical protein [Tessaracoccus flavescens]AQP51885.1 hypothetical protein BW733_14695 [Tessaracoccus flavescens]
MTQHNPKDTLQADLEALAEVFEAEDREDRRAEAQRRRDGLPEPKRDIRTFPGFADGGAAPRGVCDTAALARLSEPGCRLEA